MFNIEGDVNQINFNISNICDFYVSGDASTEYDKSIYFNIELVLERGFFNILNCEFYCFELRNLIEGLLFILNKRKNEYVFSDERNIVNVDFKRDDNSSDISVCYRLYESFDSECYITGVFYISEEKTYDIINNIKPYLSESKTYG